MRLILKCVLAGLVAGLASPATPLPELPDQRRAVWAPDGDMRKAGICQIWVIVGPLPDHVFKPEQRWPADLRRKVDIACPEGRRDVHTVPTREVAEWWRKIYREAAQRRRREARQ